MRKAESTYVGFLQHITWGGARQKSDGSWDTSAAKEVLWVVGMQLVSPYIYLRDVAVEHWVAL